LRRNRLGRETHHQETYQDAQESEDSRAHAQQAMA